MRQTFLSAAVALGVALLSGCATGYSVNVSSIKAPEALPGKSYVLRSGMKDTSEQDLLFREFSAYVNRALEKRGYTRASDLEHADLAMLLSYDIIPGGSEYEARYSTYFLPSNRPYTGRYVVQTTSRTVPQFYAAMMLKAVSAGAYRSGAESQLWVTRATALTEGDDLRAIFPLLVAGAMPYLGSETKEQITSFVTVADEAFKYVTGETGAEP